MNCRKIKQSFLKNRTLKVIIFILVVIGLQSCFNFGYVDGDSFIGKWKVEGREIYSGMTIQIVKEHNQLKGYIISKPNNTYCESLMKVNDVWIKKIERSSNFYFKITEKKIGGDLFETYDVNSKSIHFATFSEDKDTVYLDKKTPNRFVERTSVYYKRIN